MNSTERPSEITAPRLLLSAREYFLAASSLKNEVRGNRILFPKNLLYCLSIELGLKAFLKAQNFSQETLKNSYGHDLVKLLNEAEKKGLFLLKYDKMVEYSKTYNLLYKKKEMEYIDTGYYSFKEKYDKLEKDIQIFLTDIYSACYGSIGINASLSEWHAKNTFLNEAEVE